MYRNTNTNTTKSAYVLLLMFSLVTALIFVFSHLNDRITIGNGLGFDGQTYGYYVKENISKNINAYYAHRILPSLVIKYFFQIFHIIPSDKNIVEAFNVLNLILLFSSIILVFKTCMFLQMQLEQLYFTFTLVFFNYFTLKMTPFYPVLTDYFAFFLSTLIIYAYVSNNIILGIIGVIAGFFTFPTLAPVSFVLWFIGKREKESNNKVLIIFSNWIKNEKIIFFSIFLFVLIYFGIVFFYVLFKEIKGDEPFFSNMEPLNKSYAIFTAIVTAFLLFFAVYYLFKYIDFDRIIRILKINFVISLVTIILIIVMEIFLTIFVINKQLKSPTDLRNFMAVVIVQSFQKPFLSVISHVWNWGLVVVLGIIYYKKNLQRALNLGLGFLFVISIHIPLLLLISETRLLIVLLPMLAILISLNIDKHILKNKKFLAVHTLICLVFSRFWITFDDLMTTYSNLHTRFDSWYFNMGGPWTTEKGYLTIMPIALLLFVIYWFLIKKVFSKNENPRSQALS
ncbi:MAG: hypothetical protein NZ516_12085 [Raineya sp.]|nr:hypothetical protein [Raineya sp.]